ncbi:MAG TPA: GNAT family N-acetyltransferase [Halococcus sp.]|nr:GNAT family N-acetyltransferase [Halococcus sp.]
MEGPIRDATIEDISEIQRVARRGWRATYGEFIPEAVIDAILDDWYAPDQLEATITTETAIYLVSGTDEIAGYASAAPTENGEAQLYAIYVDPDHWNDGIGTELLDSITERLTTDGIERLRVEVLADNTVGTSFYESRGFERTAERDRAVGERVLSEYVYYRDL